MVEYLANLDPHVAAVVGLAVGVWAPDKYTNQCVKPLAGALVTAITGTSSDKVRDDLLEVDRSNTQPETSDEQDESQDRDNS